MNTLETASLPTCEDWFADLPTPEVSDTDYVPDIPVELLPVVQTGERIWPRVFPGL